MDYDDLLESQSKIFIYKNEYLIVLQVPDIHCFIMHRPKALFFTQRHI